MPALVLGFRPCNAGRCGGCGGRHRRGYSSAEGGSSGPGFPAPNRVPVLSIIWENTRTAS